MVVIVHFVLSLFWGFFASIPLFIRVFRLFSICIFLYCPFCGLYKTSLLYQIWNKKEEKWEDVSLSEQKIDHNNHSTTIKLYKVNEKSKKMELNETQVYFYDQKGHTIESQFIYNDGRGLRHVYTFDDLGNTQKETQYTYDPNAQTWEEINLYKYTYNTNFLKKDVEDKGNIETESIICENPLLNIRHYTKTGDSYALIRETNYFYTEIKK